MNYRTIYPLAMNNTIIQQQIKSGKISLSLRLIFLFLTLLITGISFAQDDIPEKPNPPRLVNDFAGVLTQQQIDELETLLVSFDDTTKTQIAVVTVKTLNGYAASDFAQRLGQKWGVGGKEFNNGIILLIKPKTDSERGDISIATGYGIEHLIPDATSRHIIDNVIIPEFKLGDYYAGIKSGVDAIVNATKGEYKYAKGKSADYTVLIIIVIILIIIVIISMKNDNHRTISGGKNISGPIFWPSSGGGGSSWGGFSGGGGGSFGGFGGGSFGGGGASGSW